MRFRPVSPMRRTAVIAAFAAALSASACLAQEQSLIDAARKEGSVTWYTTQIINQFARPAAEAFQKKYGVKVDYVRADSTEVALRIINEAKAGRTTGDVFDGTTVTPGLKKAGLKPEIAEITMKPTLENALAGDDALKMRKLLDALEVLDDVQEVYTTAALDEA